MTLFKEALDDMADYEFETLKQEVADLTDSNYHTEALLKIADYYNLEEFIPFLRDLSAYQSSPNYQGLEIEQLKERMHVMHQMFDILKDSIGKDKAKELYSSL